MKKSVHKGLQCQMEANWRINDVCNFNCGYCYGASRKNTFLGQRDIERVSDAFDKTGFTWLIYMSGGEPFLAPRFVELCEKLTERHMISINTNLSPRDVLHFTDRISPERVRAIHCSVHMEERRRLGLVEDFISKYKIIKEKGFYIFASYVLHPARLSHFEADARFFRSKGIVVRPKVYRGVETRFGSILEKPLLWRIKPFIGRRYPDEYTAEEKKRILDCIDRSQEEGRFQIQHHEDPWKGRLTDVWLDRFFLDGLPSFRGKYCGAGKTFIRMTPQGDAYRCHSDNEYLGNLFTGQLRLHQQTKPCRAKTCHCPYIGYHHVLKDEGEGTP